MFRFSNLLHLVLALVVAADVEHASRQDDLDIPKALDVDDQCLVAEPEGQECSLEMLSLRKQGLFGVIQEQVRQIPDVLPPPGPPGPLMTFYTYRATGPKDFAITASINTANLPGVMWYLHHEILDQWPRRFHYTRILRYKLQYRATPEIVANGMHFGIRYAIDWGKCTTSHKDCSGTWEHYGFIAGCNNLGDPKSQAFPKYPIAYNDAVWYSLPGRCPSQPYSNANPECVKRQPGGLCKGPPTGAWDCTWSYEEAGEVQLSELYSNATCNATCVEYIAVNATGCCTGFWDDINSVEANTKRVKIVADLFQEKFPKMTHASELKEPKCDFNGANYWGRLPPTQKRFGKDS